MDNNTLYFVKVNWYNEYAEDPNKCDETSYCYAFAPSLANLTARIENQFRYINDIKIREINSMCGTDDLFWCDELTKEERKKFEISNDY